MAVWNENPSGLLVPAFPSRIPMSSLPAGWQPPKPERRIYTHPGTRPSDPPAGSWSLRDLSDHIRGRANETARILIGVAVLRQRGCIWNYVVSNTGAVWQDWEGTSLESVRAHRAPCNPIIGNSNIPELAGTPAFRSALIEPLARTDFLPMVANHADSRFEKLGGATAFTNAVRFVAREQERGKPPNYDLFRHALVGVALPGYHSAWQAVTREVVDFINRETVSEIYGRTTDRNPRAPKHDIESVLEATYEFTRASGLIESSFIQQIPFHEECERFNDLESSK